MIICGSCPLLLASGLLHFPRRDSTALCVFARARSLHRPTRGGPSPPCVSLHPHHRDKQPRSIVERKVGARAEVWQVEGEGRISTMTRLEHRNFGISHL